MARFRPTVVVNTLLIAGLAAAAAAHAANRDADLPMDEIEQIVRASVGDATGEIRYQNLGGGAHSVVVPLPSHLRGRLAATHPGLAAGAEADGAEAATFFLLFNGVLNVNPALPIIGHLVSIDDDLDNYRFYTVVYNNGNSAGNPKNTSKVTCSNKTKKKTINGASTPPGFLNFLIYTATKFNVGSFVCKHESKVTGGIPGTHTSQFLNLD
jgi:hypothetical protein